jgi:hypothetical protein
MAIVLYLVIEHMKYGLYVRMITLDQAEAQAKADFLLAEEIKLDRLLADEDFPGGGGDDYNPPLPTYEIRAVDAGAPIAIGYAE